LVETLALHEEGVAVSHSWHQHPAGDACRACAVPGARRLLFAAIVGGDVLAVKKPESFPLVAALDAPRRDGRRRDLIATTSTMSPWLRRPAYPRHSVR